MDQGNFTETFSCGAHFHNMFHKPVYYGNYVISEGYHSRSYTILKTDIQ